MARNNEDKGEELFSKEAHKLSSPTTTDAKLLKGAILSLPERIQRISVKPVTAPLSTPRDADEYNMQHQKRGKALILNHMVFEPSLGLSQRNGTNVDCKSLQNCLYSLGFDVCVLQDATYREITQKIADLCMDDHSKNDCIFIALLTHGDEGIVFAQDRSYAVDNLWKNLTADQCPSLAGKPKIFLIQACRGDKFDSGTKLRAGSFASTDAISSYKIPNHADFLYIHATVPGYVSWRNAEKGSWIIQAFCNVMRQRSSTDDFLSILTAVNRSVALDYESNLRLPCGASGFKQIPLISSTLTRIIIFKPKIVAGIMGKK